MFCDTFTKYSTALWSNLKLFVVSNFPQIVELMIHAIIWLLVLSLTCCSYFVDGNCNSR